MQQQLFLWRRACVILCSPVKPPQWFSKRKLHSLTQTKDKQETEFQEYEITLENIVKSCSKRQLAWDVCQKLQKYSC